MDALRISPKPASEVLYEKDSIVVCWKCGKPIYRLQQSIYVGEPAGKSAWKYAPVEVKDIMLLMCRGDLDPGQVAILKDVPLADWQTHCDSINTIKPGDFADCPSCKQQFVYSQTRAGEDGPSSFLEKGYLWKLATIPPEGKAKRVH
jgi:hypothetical protein